MSLTYILQPEETDPEVKKAVVYATRVLDANNKFPDHFEKSRFDRFSSWHRAKKAVAICLKFKTRLHQRNPQGLSKVVDIHPSPRVIIQVSEMKKAEIEILKKVQYEHFKNEVEILQQLGTRGEFTTRELARKRNQSLKATSSLFRLDPFLDDGGLIRVGGRIERANVSSELKHPVILPRKDHISELVIRHHHEKVHHMGRCTTHNEMRQRGYWVIGGSAAVSSYIASCVTCRKLRRPLQKQKMAELPEDRLQPAPPFLYCAVDYFGPFFIRERRSEVKRWGALFTCMASRSVHLETANSLTASSFINALSRFQSRRGPIRQLRCDQGTTFVGARNELKDALADMDQNRVREYLLESDCEWIPFKMNTPHSSHMGGVWERQIGTVRSILSSLFLKSGSQLDDEAFRTLMTEIECIINSRPLTTVNLCSPDAPEPLTPNHLLTMKPKVVLPPPGRFQKEDVYSHKWWKRVQYLANEFWVRWRKEFLHNLQERKKWTKPERNIQKGDVVISKETDTTRNQWPLARVIDTYPSKDDKVRTVKLLMADGERDSQGRRKRPPSILDRPIHKLVLLVPTQDKCLLQKTRDVPDEEPTRTTTLTK
ncbi:uncharacterized protein LOC117299199 [Asterias rubens]|uniref:uncharacterized protein LOC117299199 n=1 Tax=Asterias rubens TaxID=7604 RepID=UPI001454F922|nr:uncharacterized protein LOC117299199 [Asterias rubens]